MLECPLLAEAVEKVRTIKFCATIVPMTRACSNFDSMNRGILNHCFKNFDLRDFFNSLGYERTSGRRSNTKHADPYAYAP